MIRQFLAYQMPECQVDRVFGISDAALTSRFWHTKCHTSNCRQSRAPMRIRRETSRAGESKNRRQGGSQCRIPKMRSAKFSIGQGGQTHQPDGAGRQTGLRCLRHSGSEGRRGQIRRRGRQDRDRHGLSGGDEDRLAGHPAQDRSRRRDGRRQDRRRRRKELRRPFWPTPRNTKPTPRSKASRSSRCWLGGTEVIVGAITDGSFGKLVAFGLGGVLVEVLKDITFRLAPATKAGRAVDARRHPGP